jgi:predicted transglutaminase-like protease
VLIKQNYNEEDDINHIKWLINAFKDKRYIKVYGKPIILIYRVDTIPKLSNMVSIWNNVARKNGFDGLHLCAVKTGFTQMSEMQIINTGFDAVINFQPNRQDFPAPRNISTLLYEMAQKILPDKIYQTLKLSVKSNKIVDYEALVNKNVSKQVNSSKIYPCVFPSWDNTARRKSATIIQNLNPELYKKWLNHSIDKVMQFPEDERIVFVNAWNEWAEGCHLEPDQKMGYSFLKATHDSVTGE